MKRRAHKALMERISRWPLPPLVIEPAMRGRLREAMPRTCHDLLPGDTAPVHISVANMNRGRA